MLTSFLIFLFLVIFIFIFFFSFLGCGRVIEFALSLLFVTARLEPADIRRAICLLERWASRADGEGNPRHLPHKCWYGLRWLRMAYEKERNGQETEERMGRVAIYSRKTHILFLTFFSFRWIGRAVNFQCFCCVERFTRYSARNTNTWTGLFGPW